MNLEPGGKNIRFMRDTYLVNINHPAGGYLQSLQFPDSTPKGLQKVLLERGLWPENRRFLAQSSIKSATGKSSKLNPPCLDGGSCCARALLAAQPDFKAQKNHIEEAIIKAGHEVIYYPAFHCEINFIEYFWGAAKHYARERCEYDFESLQRIVPEALASVSSHLIWKYWARTNRIMEAYRSGIIYATPEYENIVHKRCASHRRVNNHV